MAKELKESFVFYRSFFEAIEDLSENDQLQMYKAICKLALNEEETKLEGIPKILFKVMRPNINKNTEKWKNGKKGGRPSDKTKGFEKEETGGFEKEKPNVNVNVNVDVNENDNVDVNDNAQTSKHKKQFFSKSLEVEEFVRLYIDTVNPDFKASLPEKNKIAEILNEEGNFDKNYWKTVFIKAKQGWRDKGSGKKIKCTFQKILNIHSAIFSNEAYLEPVPIEKIAAQKDAPAPIPEDWVTFEKIKTKPDAVKYLLQAPERIRGRTRIHTELMEKYQISKNEIFIT